MTSPLISWPYPSAESFWFKTDSQFNPILILVKVDNLFVFRVRVRKISVFEQSWKILASGNRKIMISEEKRNLSNFSNSDFNFQFWKKMDYHNLRAVFLSIFLTLPLFFRLCQDFYVLSIWNVTISKPFTMEGRNFHWLWRRILLIED